eukprot:scaffold2587_cov101-Cylindrotheca_fusiformis.AAC.5
MDDDETIVMNDRVHFTQSLAAVSQIEKLAQKKGKNTVNERFRVTPDTHYPNTYMNRNELRQEMNMKSVNCQDLRRSPTSPRNKQDNDDDEIGQVLVEVLQCFGLPIVSAFREVSAYAIGVCGSNAFKTDVMPAVANPMWLRKMKRAAIFPLTTGAYQKVFVGVFDNGSTEPYYEFIGRVVIDISRLRPGCVYDVTLPLRQSSHVFSREPRGAIRLRLHLHWYNERAAILSYLPKRARRRHNNSADGNNFFSPNESHQIHCADERGFRNVAQVVHGRDMPGKFSLTLLKATVREIDFMRIHYSRYLRKREMYNLRHWVHPFISAFVFLSWMHAVIANTVRYIPAHIVTFLLLHMFKNYVRYGMRRGEGFIPPSLEEIFLAFVFGKEGRQRRYIEPLNMERDDQDASLDHLAVMDSTTTTTTTTTTASQDEDPTTTFEDDDEGNASHATDETESSTTDVVPLNRIAEHMRQALRVKDHRTWMGTYKDCFTGTEAVNFLLTYGYAPSRKDAVSVGKRLYKETKLFEHILQKYDFEDMPHQ